MKRLSKNFMAIAGLIIIVFITISTIPLFITKNNVGYSLGLCLCKPLGIQKQYFIYLVLQLVLIIFFIILFNNKISKILSNISFVISLFLTNVIVFIYMVLSAKAGIGIWLLLLASILIGGNKFVANQKGKTKNIIEENIIIKKTIEKPKEIYANGTFIEKTSSSNFKQHFINKLKNKNILIFLFLSIILMIFSLYMAMSTLSKEAKVIYETIYEEQLNFKDPTSVTLISANICNEVAKVKISANNSYGAKITNDYILLLDSDEKFLVNIDLDDDAQYEEYELALSSLETYNDSCSISSHDMNSKEISKINKKLKSRF